MIQHARFDYCVTLIDFWSVWCLTSVYKRGDFKVERERELLSPWNAIKSGFLIDDDGKGERETRVIIVVMEISTYLAHRWPRGRVEGMLRCCVPVGRANQSAGCWKFYIHQKLSGAYIIVGIVQPFLLIAFSFSLCVVVQRRTRKE